MWPVPMTVSHRSGLIGRAVRAPVLWGESPDIAPDIATSLHTPDKVGLSRHIYNISLQTSRSVSLYYKPNHGTAFQLRYPVPDLHDTRTGSFAAL